MKKYVSAFLCLLCVCLLLFAAGCGGDAPAVTTAAPTTEPPIDGAKLFADAIAPVQNAPDLSIQATVKQTVSVGPVSYESNLTQTLNYHNAADGTFTASVSEKVSIEDTTMHYEEIFTDGKTYSDLEGICVLAEMTPEEFTAQYTPAVMLDPALYSTITVTEDMASITFADATALEAWVTDKDAELISATATAKLNAQQTLESTTYEASYRVGTATYSTTVTARVCPPDTTPVTTPEDTDSYRAVADLGVIKTFYSMSSYIANADYITTSMHQSTFSQAAGIVLSEQTIFDSYGQGKDAIAKGKESVIYSNYATGENVDETMETSFLDGKCTIIVNDDAPQEGKDMTADSVRQYYRALLVGSMLPIILFEDVTVTDLDGITLYELVPSEDMNELVRGMVSEQLFEKDTFLDELASAYKVNESTMYLSVDNSTGLPIAFGLKYEGCHTINDVEYILSRQTDMSFDLASMSAYETITEKIAPDTEPEQKPTPLLYHVTGTDGQEMWLFGTIHIGDDSTAFLPQKLWDAFDSSDALALEIDSKALTKRLESDDALQEQLQTVYFYTDATTKEHIQDSALYEKALSLMKATGNYFYNTDYMQVNSWETALHQSYLRLGYDLTDGKGLEARLKQRAEGQGKPVLEVEDLMEHVSFANRWSPELQEYMLKQTVDTTIAEYCAESRKLYDLWCAGDEAALKEAVADTDADEIPEEELPLAEEYNETMMVKRNALMLEKAKGYLESDQVVFYAVGLAHLLVEDGLVNTLRAAGYTVELVTYS